MIVGNRSTETTRRARRTSWLTARTISALMGVLCCLVAFAPSVRADDPAEAGASAPLSLDPHAVTKVTIHPRAGVSTYELSSGVVVHLRPMPAASRIAISATVLGFEATETAETKGFTQAGAASLVGPVLGPVTRAVTPEGLIVRASLQPDRLSDDLPRAVALLTDVQVSAHQLSAWKQRQLDIIATRASRKEQAAVEGMQALMWGPLGAADPRRRQVNPSDIQRITLEDVRAWVREGFASQPIEVAVVGAFDLERDGPTILAAFAQIPPRPDGAWSRVLDQRNAAAPEGARRIDVSTDLPPGLQYVLVGYRGPDLSELSDCRAVQVVAELVRSRLQAQCNAEGLVVDQISVVVMPGRLLSNSGLILSSARVQGDTDSARVLATVLHRTFQEVGGVSKDAATHPTVDEIRAATDKIAQVSTQLLTQPEYWAGVLTFSRYYGLSPTIMADAPAAYRRLGPSDLNAAVRRWCSDAGRYTLLLVAP